MLDKRRTLIYREEIVTRRRWRRPTTSLRCVWRVGSSLRITLVGWHREIWKEHDA